MEKKENLRKILEKIKNINKHHFERSLYVDFNEMMILCENIIKNNVKNIIEIGTYKGVTAAVFASIIDGTLYTINVDDGEIDISKKIWDDLGITNIVQKKGSSLDVLPELVKEVDDVGFIYVDGNHAIPYAATEFSIISGSKISEGDCLVYFDDGPLPGVMEAIQKYKLTTLQKLEWMLIDEKNKGGSGTLRAYTTFGDFNVKF